MGSSSANVNSFAMFNALSKDDEEMDRPFPEPMEDFHVANADADRVYGCKYCQKKFSNKQALGGHQNAHKIERAMEKNARQLQENQFGYFDGPSSYPVVASSPPFPSSFNIRSHEFIDGAMVNVPYQSLQPMPHAMPIDPYARPVLPMAEATYAPHPIPGFNHVYPGWNAPVPRMYQFVTPPSHMQNSVLNPGSQPLEMGSSSAAPVFDPHPTFNGSLPVSGGVLGDQVNNQKNNAENEVEDPDLDLSLRL